MSDIPDISDISSLHAFLVSPINRVNLLDDLDRAHGFFTNVVEVVANYTEKSARCDFELEQVRDQFAEKLSLQGGGKVTDAEAKRRVVRLEEYAVKMDEKISADKTVVLFGGYAKMLDRRYNAVLSLLNWQAKEMRLHG